MKPEAPSQKDLARVLAEASASKELQSGIKQLAMLTTQPQVEVKVLDLHQFSSSDGIRLEVEVDEKYPKFYHPRTYLTIPNSIENSLLLVKYDGKPDTFLPTRVPFMSQHPRKPYFHELGLIIPFPRVEPDPDPFFQKPNENRQLLFLHRTKNPKEFPNDSVPFLMSPGQRTTAAYLFSLDNLTQENYIQNEPTKLLPSPIHHIFLVPLSYLKNFNNQLCIKV